MRKIFEEVKVINLFASTAVTADINGTGLDVEVYENDAMAILNTGLITSTTATYLVDIQASTAVNGTYTSIGTFNIFSGTASSYKTASLPLGLDAIAGARKFVRAVVDVTANGGTVNGVIGVTLQVRPTRLTVDMNSSTLA